MILVDVEVPAIGQTYNFQIDEHVKMEDLAVEIRDMICMQKQCACVGLENRLTLWDVQRQIELPGGADAQACGITTGSKLILV